MEAKERGERVRDNTTERLKDFNVEELHLSLLSTNATPTITPNFAVLISDKPTATLLPC